MSTYKVIQDIEAEDKLLGPLTLRQFIYAIIVVVSGFLIFRLILVKWWLALPLLPHTIFFALLAAPFGHDQSSEVWLLAKIRFAIKPRKRIWDQSGIKELVTITAPKKIERALTKGLSQTEVRSRLQALASTIDSRGWATKNVNVNLSTPTTFAMATPGSDRLVDASTLPQDVAAFDVHPSEDMFDERNNPTAQNLDRLMTNSQQAHRQQIVQQMQGKTAAVSNQQPPPDYWFMNETASQPVQPGYAIGRSQVVAPGSTVSDNTPQQPVPGEEALLERLHESKDKPKAAYGHMRTILPLSEQPASPTPPPPVQTQATTPVTAPPDPAILELANNDDLNVATIARQANKRKKEPPQDEVVVSLH